jgi:hypothetical protein
MEDTGDIPNPPTLAAHLDNLGFDLGSEPLVAVGTENRGTLARHMLTAKAWLAIRRVAIFHHLDTLTCRTMHRFECQTTPLGAGPSAHDAVPVAVCLDHGCLRKSTNPEHYRHRFISRDATAPKDLHRGPFGRKSSSTRSSQVARAWLPSRRSAWGVGAKVGTLLSMSLGVLCCHADWKHVTPIRKEAFQRLSAVGNLPRLCQSVIGLYGRSSPRRPTPLDGEHPG